MPCISLEIQESKEFPGAYSIKINGREVSKDIISLQLNLEAGSVPTLTVKSVVEGINLASRVLWDIPAPYGSWLEQELEQKSLPPLMGREGRKETER